MVLQKENLSSPNPDDAHLSSTAYRLIKVEVAYAATNQQKIYPVEVVTGSTIAAAIVKSGVLTDFPEINFGTQKVGIFSKLHTLQDIVTEGDRIEIYRSLLADPKERRRKAVNAIDKQKEIEKQRNKSRVKKI